MTAGGGYLALAERDSLRGCGARSSSVGSCCGEELTTGLTEHPLIAAWLRVERSAVKSVNSFVSLEVKTRGYALGLGPIWSISEG